MLYAAVARQIRPIDPNRPLVIAARGVGPRAIKRIRDVQSVVGPYWVSVHLWTRPNPYIQTEVPSAPAYPNSQMNRAMLRNYIKPLIEYRQANPRRRILVGEFGALHSRQGLDRFFADYISLFSRHGIHWTAHAYREASVWNYELNPDAWLVLTNGMMQ